jgi:DNA topoisomerase-2
MSARNPEFHGVFPLKGKPVNVRGMKVKDMISNEELSNLMTIIGLQFNEVADIKNLRYSELVIAVDADADGSHICALICNMFSVLWPNLLKNGFIFKLMTPIVRVTQGKKMIEFLTLNEYTAWVDKQTVKFSTTYVKGLGSNDTKYFKAYMNDQKYKVNLTYTDNNDADSLIIAFDKSTADLRKEFIYG